MSSYTVEIEIPEDCDMEQAGGTVTVVCDEDEYVLAAARSQGVWLPAFCQQGWCTTCAATLRSGSVDQSDAKRYYEVDEEAGFILPCTATPQSDLDLEACKHDEILEHREDHDLPP